MSINKIVELFLLKNPSLKQMFDTMKKKYYVADDAGTYVVWGLGVMSCVLELLQDPIHNKALLQRIFDFFEEMATSEEEEVRELLMYSTLETLDDDKEVLKIALSFMGNETKKLLYRVQAFLGE